MALDKISIADLIAEAYQFGDNWYTSYKSFDFRWDTDLIMGLIDDEEVYLGDLINTLTIRTEYIEVTKDDETETPPDSSRISIHYFVDNSFIKIFGSFWDIK